MAKIDKLISKFNKVKSSINSIKGIASKIDSINYVSGIDSLGESAKAAREKLKARQDNIRQQRAGISEAVARKHQQNPPEKIGGSYIYPFHDPLINYITFDILPRRHRNSEKTVVDGGDQVTAGKSQAAGEDGTGVFMRRSVSLYVPDALISQSSVVYRQEGKSTFMRAIVKAAEGLAGGGDALDIGGEVVQTMGTKFIMEAINKMTGGMSNLRFGRASNPQMEQILDNIPLRSWDFTFDFWPKSAKEALEVRNIINTFRESMLPDTFSDKVTKVVEAMETGNMPTDPSKIQTNASYFNYPNVFQIYFSGPIADKVDGFLPAVCTNAQVDYTGGQKFSTFEDGMPVHVQLTLNFLEIKAMSLGNYQKISANSNVGNMFGSNASLEGDSVHYSTALTRADAVEAVSTPAPAPAPAPNYGWPGKAM